MITKGYVDNLFNKSKVWTNVIQELGLCIMVCQLPNKTVIVKSGGCFKYCEEEIKAEILDYEEYLDSDRKHYGYYLHEEFIEVVDNG